MNSKGRMGVTMICSRVPISRSRTTAKAVSVITSTSVRLPMMPGTKNQRLFRSGLYQGRGASSTEGMSSINCGAMRPMRSCWYSEAKPCAIWAM